MGTHERAGASPSCVLIAGQGRSGTNWLLYILDASERTHCRNEPDGIAGAALSTLPIGWIPPDDAEAFGAHWDRAIERIRCTAGQTDHPPSVPKTFLRSWTRRSGLYGRLLLSPRLRRALSPLEPRFSRHPWEFEIPGWLGDRRELSRALTVIKLCQVPGWIRWVLEHRPGIPVLHIVRHPGGFLNSWTNRWLSKNDEAAVAEENRRRLETVRSAEPEWSDRFGDIQAMRVQESELWFWRYAAESIHEAGRASDGYQLVIYEELAAKPEEHLDEIYRRCGLPVTSGVRKQLVRLAASSNSIAGAWRHELSPHDRDCVERVLEGSPAKDWWE